MTAEITAAGCRALRTIADDYMTSEQHHPGYVLIPSEKFEALRQIAALLEAGDCAVSGLSLRDRFAMAALAGRTGSPEFAARDAYTIADEMMKKRRGS